MGFYGLCGWVIGLSFRGKRKRIQNPDMGLHGSAVTVVGLLVGRLLALSFVVLFFSAALAMQHQTETRGRVAPTHPDKPQGIFFSLSLSSARYHRQRHTLYPTFARSVTDHTLTLACRVPSRGAVSTIRFIADPARIGFEPSTSRTPGGRSNHYATGAYVLDDTSSAVHACVNYLSSTSIAVLFCWRWVFFFVFPPSSLLTSNQCRRFRHARATSQQTGRP